MNHSRLEQYLDELARPLTSLGETARREWREEARQHLADLAAAHEELGTDPDVALEQALHQFGDAAKIGRAVQRESTYFWQRAAFWRALLLPASAVGGGALLVSTAGYLLPRFDFLDGTMSRTFLVYAALGAATAASAVAGKRRLAWPLGGACLAALAGPLIAHLTDTVMCLVRGHPIGYYQTDPIQVFCYAVPVGVFVWARRVAPARAARGASLAYLVTLLGVYIVMALGRHPLGDILRGLPVLLTGIALWGLQGALVGGVLGVTRQVAGSICERGRRRFERVGSFAEFTTR